MKAWIGREVTGPAGTATEIIAEAFDRPEQAATLATWFLHCPGQSPAWDSYMLSVIHLRTIEGVREPVIRFPGATHEVLLAALDPGSAPSVDNPDSWQLLMPINVEEQVELPDDEAAVRLAELAARAVVTGALWAEPPLSGQVEPWRTTLVKTAAHARGEEHAP